MVMSLWLPSAAFLSKARSGDKWPSAHLPLLQQHGHQTLGRQHPPSRGEESESNYLNCPGGPGSRESQPWTVEGKWPGHSGSGSSRCQTSNFLSTPSAYTPSTFPRLAPHMQDIGHRLRTLGQQCKQTLTGLPEVQSLQTKGPSHSGLMADKSLSHSRAQTK